MALAAALAALAALALLQRLLRPHLWADLAFAARAARCRRRAGGGGGGSLAARFLRAARETPARPFLRAAGGAEPYGRAARRVARVANALRRRPLGGGEGGELGPGVTVGLLVGNEPRFVWGWLGLAALGARPAFLGTALRPAALRHCLRACGARALLVADDLFAAVEPILPSLQEDGIVVWVLGSGPYPPGVLALQELLDAASEELEPEDVWQPEDMNETCLYIFTSGTTGLPKAARVSHLKSIMCLSFYELVGASSRDVVYLALPLYHMAGSLLGIVGCIGIGATCVLKEKFSASQFWDDCRAEGVTVFQYIGELCRYLVNQPPRPGEREHGLRLAVGSGLRPDVWRSFLQRFGAIRIVETYGMTEGNVTLFNYTGTPGAVGRSSFIYKLFSPFEIVRYDVTEGAPVRDAAGRCIRVGTGETGLLIAPVTPRTPFLGYAGSRELSEQKLLRGVFAEGDTYFSTGDLMEQDAAQFVRFRDRTGDTYRCQRPPPMGDTPPPWGQRSSPIRPIHCMAGVGGSSAPSCSSPSQVERRERGHHRGGRSLGGPRVPARSHRLRCHRARPRGSCGDGGAGAAPRLPAGRSRALPARGAAPAALRPAPLPPAAGAPGDDGDLQAAEGAAGAGGLRSGSRPRSPLPAG